MVIGLIGFEPLRYLSRHKLRDALVKHVMGYIMDPSIVPLSELVSIYPLSVSVVEVNQAAYLVAHSGRNGKC